MSTTITVKLSPEELRPGYELEKYTLLEALSRGGQAFVWSAWDKQHERVVAIKFFVAKSDNPLAGQDSFEREVQAIASLNHPSILPLYDIGRAGEFVYLAMQYIPSGSLESFLRSGAFQPPDALRITAQLIAALDYIHRYKVVHRDLKPSNILLDSQERVYLSDFGLAKRIGDTTAVLHTGHGTAPYAPPEQHVKKSISLRSDIYSLGILLFEMLTGSLPWDGDSPLALRQMNSRENLPDPRDTNPVLPAALVDALRRLTAADPDDRPASAMQAFSIVAQAFDESNHATTDLAFSLSDNVNEPTAQIDNDSWKVDEARHLLERALAGGEDYWISHSHFAFIDAIYSHTNQHNLSLDDPTRRFMLRSALTHGHNLQHWWDALDDSPARLQVCEEAIANEGRSATRRAIVQLIAEPTDAIQLEKLSASTLERLIEFAATSPDTPVGQSALVLLEHAVMPATQWQPVRFTSISDRRLANLALSDGPSVIGAARLIGKIRSETAVQMLLDAQKGMGTRHVSPALINVQEVAGNLPRSTPIVLRLRLITELARQQILRNRSLLTRAFVSAALGSALGIGTHAYMTYRVTGFLDTARILITLGNGLIFGPIIGLGIFVTLLIVQRLLLLSLIQRMTLGIGVGALIVNLGFQGLHTLVLGTRPVGWLIAMGSVLTTLGFGVSAGLFRSKWLRALISVTTVGLGIGLSWQLHVLTSLTPMLYYEVNQPMRTVILILVTATLMGSVAHIVDLSIFDSEVAEQAR